MKNHLPFGIFLQSLKISNRTLDFFTDWQKCLKNKDEISIALNHLNFLLGKDTKELKNCVKSLFKEYPKAFNYQWINNAKKALKNTGSLLISGTYHNIFSLGRILQKLDFKILNLITWQKTNPPPNFSCRYLTHSAEQIIWARKSHKHKHVFNYEVLKKINNDKQMRDVWNFPAIAPWEKQTASTPLKNPSLCWCACF